MSTSSTIPLYNDCVASLRTALSFLDASVATVDAGVADLPRIQTVLKTVRHYELIPQPTLAAAEASLQNEIGPSVAALLDRAEHQLARQARRIDTLQAKATLQAGRLETKGDGDDNFDKGKGKGLSKQLSSKNSTSTRKTNSRASIDPLRARMTRQRREQLKYSIARLEREVAQKERELRKQLAQQTD